MSKWNSAERLAAADERWALCLKNGKYPAVLCGLTPLYHLIYPDWDKSMDRQASVLDSIIRENWGKTVSSVLDVSCGIGTQALGLAKLGYEATASDLSREEVECAKAEAEKRGL